jgi:hypothetical protein
MACGFSTVARLGLAAVLATAACRKSESDTGLSFDSAARPSGMGEPDAGGTAIADGDGPEIAAGADLLGDTAAARAGKWKPPGGDFGAVAVGQESAPQTFTFTCGDGPTGTLATQLGGPDALSFLIAEDLCQGTSLPPAGTCAVTLRFKPVKAGELAASLTLTAPSRGDAVLVVGGTGVAP